MKPEVEINGLKKRKESKILEALRLSKDQSIETRVPYKCYHEKFCTHYWKRPWLEEELRERHLNTEV